MLFLSEDLCSALLGVGASPTLGLFQGPYTLHSSLRLALVPEVSAETQCPSSFA